MLHAWTFSGLSVWSQRGKPPLVAASSLTSSFWCQVWQWKIVVCIWLFCERAGIRWHWQHVIFCCLSFWRLGKWHYLYMAILWLYSMCQHWSILLKCAKKSLCRALAKRFLERFSLISNVYYSSKYFNNFPMAVWALYYCKAFSRVVAPISWVICPFYYSSLLTPLPTINTCQYFPKRVGSLALWSHEKGARPTTGSRALTSVIFFTGCEARTSHRTWSPFCGMRPQLSHCLLYILWL